MNTAFRRSNPRRENSSSRRWKSFSSDRGLISQRSSKRRTRELETRGCFHFLVRDVAHFLRKRPVVTLGIRGDIRAVAVELIFERPDDAGASALGFLEMRVDL